MQVSIDRGRAASIVGRDGQLEALDEMVSDESGGTIVIAGDAGVGKTRLLTEFLDRLVARGWRTLVGHCLDFGDTAMPYLPFTELLRRLDQSDSEVAARLAEKHPALAQLARQARSTTRPDADSDETLQRAEIFDSMHSLIEDLASISPVAIVIEDAHWADTSSRDLLSFLLRRGFDGPANLVVTYRSDDLHRRHPLRKLVAEWARVPDVERVQVGPLAPDDVRRMVDAITGGAGAEQYREDVERIVARADGNAFYVEELVGAFLSGGWSLPEDLADLLLVRLDRLDDDARELVREASVAGQRVSHELLAEVSQLDGSRLDAALRSAIDAHVLVAAGDDGYSFRHALLGEAVYDDLLPGERMRLHTAYATAIAGPICGSHAALARHALASHDLRTALLASIEAGEKALAVGGPEEAARHFQTALEIYDRASATMTDPPDLATLIGLAAQALVDSGDPDRAAELLRQQLEFLAPEQAPLGRARLLIAAVEAASATEPDEDPRKLAEEALELVGEEPSKLRARALAASATTLLNHGDPTLSRQRADAAMELAEQLAMPKLAAQVRLLMVRLGLYLGDDREAASDLERLIAEARQHGDINGEMQAQFRAAHVHVDSGDLASAQAAFLAVSELAARDGRPWTPYGFDARARGALMAAMQGHWDEALAIVDMSGQNPPPGARALLGAVTMIVAAGRGDVSALDGFSAIRERWRRDGLVAVLSAGPAIELYSLRDGAAAALAAYDDADELLSDLWETDYQARARLAATALGALADHATTVPHDDRPAAVADGLRLVGHVDGVEAKLATRNKTFGVEGRAWVERAHAEYLRLRWLLGIDPPSQEELRLAWQATTDSFTVLGQVFEEGRSRARLAAVLQAVGDHSAADAELRRTREIAEMLSSPLLLTQSGASATRSRRDGAGAAHPPGARDPHPRSRRPQQRRDRQAALHRHQDRLRARLQHPGQARRRRPHRGRRHRPPRKPPLS